MDEIWEKAVEMALAGEKEPAAARVLTLDGAVKCIQGHLPRPELLEKYQNLEHLSIANIGVSSLEQFPRLGKLQKLVLSDNRIAGGLEFLVQAGLGSLRDLDLSNNRIHLIEDLVPLAELKLVSLDLYECPVTKMKDYRSRVFGLVKSLKYLDKMDAEENERPESEEEDEDDEEDDDEEEDEEDPGSCEIDGEERTNGMRNGHSGRLEEVLEVDEEESEADEEETETGRQSNGVSDHANEFRDENLNMDGEESDDSDEEDAYEEDGPLIGDDSHDSDEGDEDDDEEQVDNDEGRLRVSPRNIFGDFHGETGMQPNGVSDDANGFQHVLVNLEDDSDGEDEYEDNGLLVNDTEDMDEEDDGLIVLNTEDLDEEDGEEEEELGNDVGDVGLPERNGLLRNMMMEEIDGHEQGEDDGESSEDDGVEDGEEEDEEYVAELLARPVAEAIEVDEEGEGEEDYSDDDEGHVVYPIASSSHLKRKRDDDDGSDSVSDSSDNNDDDDDGSSDGDGDGDDE